jgi:hypothetical protein
MTEPLTITDDQLEELGQLADELDNMCGAMELPMPAAFHIEQLKVLLPKVSTKIKALVVAIGGDDPWSETP